MIILSISLVVMACVVAWLGVRQIDLENQLEESKRESRHNAFEFFKGSLDVVNDATLIKVPVITGDGYKATGLTEISIKKALILLMKHLNLSFGYRKIEELEVSSTQVEPRRRK